MLAANEVLTLQGVLVVTEALAERPTSVDPSNCTSCAWVVHSRVHKEGGFCFRQIHGVQPSIATTRLDFAHTRHATVEVQLLLAGAPRLRSSTPRPKTDSGGKWKYCVPDRQSHGLSIQRKILQHKIRIPTILGSGDPSFKKRFSRKLLPVHLSYHASHQA